MKIAAPARTLAFILITALVAMLLAVMPSQRSAAADTFDAVRDTWRTMLTGGTAYDPAIPAIAARYVDGYLKWSGSPSQGSGTADLVLGTDATPTGTFQVDSVRAGTGAPN